MWGSDPDILHAMTVLGLGPDASLADAKSAFRRRAMALHPDQTPATPETLSRLADAVHAIRCLEQSAQIGTVLVISAAEARKGVSRTVTRKGRSGVFRIEPGTVSGTRISAVGETAFIAVIRIQEQPGRGQEDAGTGLGRFIDDFVRSPPAARFAGWLRKARSAA